MIGGTLTGTRRIEDALASARDRRRAALIPFVVGGRPSRATFATVLEEVARHSDLIEVGVPFSDPVADGPVIASASRAALAEGVTLSGLLDDLVAHPVGVPLVLFSYLNPLLALGLEKTVERALGAGCAGLVVPDLTADAEVDEARELAALCEARGLAWIQLVTPLTEPARRDRLLAGARGFVYAVLRSGITGARTDPAATIPFLASLRYAASIPVCAGFGVRDAEQARRLSEHTDGLIVGTALVDALERGDSPTSFLEPLRRAANRP